VEEVKRRGKGKGEGEGRDKEREGIRERVGRGRTMGIAHPLFSA